MSMLWWCIIVLLVYLYSATPQDVFCFFSSDAVLLNRNSVTKNTLEHGFSPLSDSDSIYKKACHLVLTIFFENVRVQFTSNPELIGRTLTQESSLTIITSIDYTRSNYIQTQLIYVCDETSKNSHYCNHDYYFKLSSGELFWIFNTNYTELSMLLKPILYSEDNKIEPQLNCFEEGKLNALPCYEDVCFARQIGNETNSTEINFGMPKSWFTKKDVDISVRINIEIRLCLNGETYFEFSYTYNTNQCNGQDTINRVDEIISQYYNISRLQLPSNLYKPELFASYCQRTTQKSTQSSTFSSSTTKTITSKSPSTTTATRKTKATDKITQTSRSYSTITTMISTKTNSYSTISTMITSNTEESSFITTSNEMITTDTSQTNGNTSVYIKQYFAFLFVLVLLD